MRTSPNKLLIQNLEGVWPPESLYYMPKEQALEELKNLTGKDFGYDTRAWRQWFKKRSNKTDKKTNHNQT